MISKKIPKKKHPACIYYNMRHVINIIVQCGIKMLWKKYILIRTLTNAI